MQRVLVITRHIAVSPCVAKSTSGAITNATRILNNAPSYYYSTGFDILQKAPVAAVHLAQSVLQNVHDHSHLPWWAVILGSTFVLRSAVTLPLAVYQQKILAKMELLMPTLKEYQEAVKHNVIVKCRRANLPVEEANRRIRKEVIVSNRTLYTEFKSLSGCFFKISNILRTRIGVSVIEL